MKVLSVASAVPADVVKNDAIEDRLGLERGWIERRTGILERPTASSSEATSDLAVRAASCAIQKSSIDPQDIGLLLLATSTPDHLLPPTAPLVAHRLGLTRTGAVDLVGACSGFLYAFVLAAVYGQSSQKAVIVVGANVLTRRVNQRDAATAAMFSDGAGAAVLVPSEPSQLLGSHLGSDGSFYDVIGVPAGGSREPLTPEGLSQGRHLMTLRNGPALFKQAVHGMTKAGNEAMKSAGLGPESIDWWIPHQANSRILSETGRMLGIPSERTVQTVDKFGNSSAATIPIAWAQCIETGRLRSGDMLLLTAAGAGLVTAGVVLRW